MMNRQDTIKTLQQIAAEIAQEMGYTETASVRPLFFVVFFSFAFRHCMEPVTCSRSSFLPLFLTDIRITRGRVH